MVLTKIERGLGRRGKRGGGGRGMRIGNGEHLTALADSPTLSGFRGHSFRMRELLDNKTYRSGRGSWLLRDIAWPDDCYKGR